MSAIYYYDNSRVDIMNRLSLDRPDNTKYWEIEITDINWFIMTNWDNDDIVQRVKLPITCSYVNSKQVNIHSAVYISNGKDHKMSIKLNGFKSDMTKLHQLFMEQPIDENEIIALIDKLLNHKDSIIYKYNQYKSALDDF